MIQALLMVGSCLAALVVLTVCAPQVESPPRHVYTGVGTVTVAQLQARLSREQLEGEPLRWPLTDPDANVDADVRPAGRGRLPGTLYEPSRWSSPTPEHLRRVVEGLRRL